MRAKTLVKIRGRVAKTLSVLLTLSLLMALMPTAALANINGYAFEVEVNATATDASQTVGDVDTTDCGIGATASNGYTASVAAGNVSSSGVYGVLATADKGGAATIAADNVTGSQYERNVVGASANGGVATVTVDSVDAAMVRDGYSHRQAVEASASNNGAATVTVYNDVNLDATADTGSHLSAVHAHTNGSGNATITAGDVTIQDGEYAIKAETNGGGTVTVTTGDVTTTDTASGSSQLGAVHATAIAGTTRLTMGDLNGQGGTLVGLRAYSHDGGNLTVNVEDISMERDGGYALYGSVYDAGSVASLTTGDISALGHGLYIGSEAGATLNLTTGNISGAQYNNLSANGTTTATLGDIASPNEGLNLANGEGGKLTVETGSITGGNNAAVSIYARPSDNPLKLTVNGDVTGNKTNGFYLSSSPGPVDITVNGDVTTNDGRAVTGNLQGSFVVNGSVSSTNSDAFNTSQYGDQTLDILVTDTVSGTGSAFNTNADSYATTTLTAWKVTSTSGTLYDGDTDGAFAQRVNYIVKVADPGIAGVTLAAKKANGSALDISHGYDVAHEGDRIILSATLPDGYHIDKAYNGTGANKVALSKDANGNFYYDVPAGGGIYLSAEINNDYDITFVNEDGTELQSGKVAYGETPAYTGETPAKEPTASQVFTFLGWNPALAPVTGDATYRATYTATAREYAITFKNWDGIVLQSDDVAWGQTPTYTGETPTRPADAQYTYTFAGWTPEIEPVTGEATYTATYTKTTNTYDITFKNWDGTVLQTGKVAWGEMPTYTGETPTKEANAQFTYTFSGWAPEVVPVAGEATYTATFAEETRSYSITFDLAGGTLNGKTGIITMIAVYGATITLPEAPTREGYTFLYWEGSRYEAGAEYLVEGDHAFTAAWEKDSGPTPVEPTEPVKPTPTEPTEPVKPTPTTPTQGNPTPEKKAEQNPTNQAGPKSNNTGTPAMGDPVAALTGVMAALTATSAGAFAGGFALRRRMRRDR